MKKATAKRVRVWLPIIMGLAGLAATFSLWKTLAADETEALTAPTRAALASTKTEIHAHLHARVSALQHLQKRWEEQENPPRKEWQSDAWLFLSQFPDIRRVLWVDSDLKVRRGVPKLTGKEPKDVLEAFREARAGFLARAKESNRITISGPIDLLEGGKGFLVCAPVQRDNEFGGAVVSVHDADRLLEGALDSVAPGYNVALSRNGVEIYRRGDPDDKARVILGGSGPRHEESYLRLHNAGWLVRVTPEAARLGAAGTPVSLLILIVGIVTSLLLMLMFHLALSSEARAMELDQANRGIVAQIADRKRAESALRESEERFRQLAEHTDQVLWVRNLNEFSFVYVSPSFEQLWGMPCDDARDDPEAWINGIHEEDRDRVTRSLQHDSASGDYREEYRVVRKDGSVRWVQDRGVPVRDERGNIHQIVGITDDITELKLAGTEVERLQRRLDAVGDEMESFLRAASGELQEPARKIFVLGKRVEESCGDNMPKKAKDDLNRLLTAAERMQGFVEGLKTYAKTSAQDQPLTATNLKELAQGVLAEFDSRVQEAGGKFSLEDLPALESDPDQMRELLRHLIDNALKFQKPDAPPKVKIWSRRASPSEAGEGADGKAVQGVDIIIEDNGIGFEDEARERIFGMFQKLSSSGDYKGSGMGLAVCRAIVQRHGGRIRAESKKGKGSKFIVTLPTGKGAAKGSETRKAA